MKFTRFHIELAHQNGMRDFSNLNLSGSDLSGSNLSGSNLRRSDLSGSNLKWSNLSGSDLIGSNLSGSDLIGSNFYLFNITPETGDFDGWKKCKDGVIVRLRILSKERSNAPGSRKCRARTVKVLEVIGGKIGFSSFDANVVYKKGKKITSDFDPNPANECSEGIHFFLSQKEAEDYRS